MIVARLYMLDDINHYFVGKQNKTMTRLPEDGYWKEPPNGISDKILDSAVRVMYPGARSINGKFDVELGIIDRKVKVSFEMNKNSKNGVCLNLAVFFEVTNGCYRIIKSALFKDTPTMFNMGNRGHFTITLPKEYSRPRELKVTTFRLNICNNGPNVVYTLDEIQKELDTYLVQKKYFTPVLTHSECNTVQYSINMFLKNGGFFANNTNQVFVTRNAVMESINLCKATLEKDFAKHATKFMPNCILVYEIVDDNQIQILAANMIDFEKYDTYNVDITLRARILPIYNRINKSTVQYTAKPSEVVEVEPLTHFTTDGRFLINSFEIVKDTWTPASIDLEDDPLEILDLEGKIFTDLKNAKKAMIDTMKKKYKVAVFNASGNLKFKITDYTNSELNFNVQSKNDKLVSNFAFVVFEKHPDGYYTINAIDLQDITIDKYGIDCMIENVREY